MNIFGKIAAGLKKSSLEVQTNPFTKSGEDFSAEEELALEMCRKLRKEVNKNCLNETPQFADKIDVIELKNILAYAERCKYDLTEKDFTFFRCKTGKTHRGWDGEYALWNGSLYALAKSQYGPVFIIEHELYFLKNHKFMFYHESISNSKCFFKAVIDDNIVAEVRYPDPGWCDIFDDIDLGHWIAERSKDDDFIERYTKIY